MYRDEPGHVKYGKSGSTPHAEENAVDWSIPTWEPNYIGILGPVWLDIPDILNRTPERETLVLELGERAADGYILGAADILSEYYFFKANGFFSNGQF